ncbi:MAG: DUF4376 domain-containing protein [Pseudomonadota bacterium]
MIRSAFIKNNTVANVIVGTMEGHIPCPDEVGIGWLYDGTRFTPPAAPVPTQEEQREQIDTVRDERMGAGFVFGGRRYQSRPQDLERITATGLQAQAAIQDGTGQVDNLRWHGDDTDFIWIDADNNLVPMDAPTVLAFARAANAHVRAHTLAARLIKDDILAGREVVIENDPRWPPRPERESRE